MAEPFDREAYIEQYAKHAYALYAGKKRVEPPEISNFNNAEQLAVSMALLSVMVDVQKATAQSLNITDEQFKNWELAAAMERIEAAQRRGTAEREKQSGQRGKG